MAMESAPAIRKNSDVYSLFSAQPKEVPFLLPFRRGCAIMRITEAYSGRNMCPDTISAAG